MVQAFYGKQILCVNTILFIMYSIDDKLLYMYFVVFVFCTYLGI